MRLRRLPPRETTPIGAHALFEGAKRVAGNDVIFVAIEDAGGNGRVHLGDGSNLLQNHALHFTLCDCTACRQSNHAQRNDALSLDAELDRFKSNVKPRIEQKGHRKWLRKRIGPALACTLTRLLHIGQRLIGHKLTLKREEVPLSG